MSEGLKKCQPRLLTPYIDGELADEVRGQVEEHLRGCPSCGALLDEISVASEHVRTMGRATIPTTALEPARDMFAERAGSGTGVTLADTVEVARDSGAAVESQQLELEAPAEEPEPADDEIEAIEAAAAEALAAEAAEAAAAEKAAAEAAAAEAAAAEAAAAEKAAVEQAAAEAAAAEQAAAEQAAAAQAAAEQAAAEQAAAEQAAAEQAAAAEPAVDLHAEAPPHELRPPWLSESEVEDDRSLEAVGRAAVEDVMAHEGESDALTPDGGAPEADATPEDQPADSEGEPPATDEPAAGESAPVPPLEPRLEPLPEPWRTVWRPGGLPPDPLPEPAAKPTAAEHAPAQTATPPPVSMEGSEAGWTGGDRPLPEVEEVVARLRGDLSEDAESSLPPEQSASSLDDYRDTLRRRPQRRRGFAAGIDLSVRSTQLKVAAIAAAVILVLGGGIAAALALSRSPAKNSTTATQPKPAAPASTAPTAAAGGAPSAAPTAATAAQLTGPVTVGSGGNGFKVERIRTGSPGGGTFRMVLDLQGSGPMPTAQLGHGPDGADYLIASGISIDPSVVQAFTPGGPVTGITQSGAGGLNLRLAVNQNPQYGMGYLSGPTRLVIDFK